MKEIKRRLMQNYVEMQDGTFAVEVDGNLIPVHEDEDILLPRGYVVFADKACAKYDATTGKYIPASRDEACAKYDATTGKYIPASWDEAWSFQHELDEAFNAEDECDYEGLPLDCYLDELVRGTNEETRRFLYFWIAGDFCPKWWRAAVSCCFHDVDKHFGNSRIQSIMVNRMQYELAQERCGELGVTSIVFLRVYKLLAAMQRDLEAGTNLDVVDFLLNEWEEWGSCPGSSMWDYEETEHHDSCKDEDMEIEDVDDDYWDEPEIMDEDMAYWYEQGCPENDCPGFRGD